MLCKVGYMCVSHINSNDQAWVLISDMSIRRASKDISHMTGLMNKDDFM